MAWTDRRTECLEILTLVTSKAAHVMTPSEQATPRLELYSALIMGLRDTTYPSLSSSPSASTPNHLMTCSGGTIYGVDEGVTEGGVWFK